MKTYEAHGFKVVDCVGMPEDAVKYALANIAFADCVGDVPIVLVDEKTLDAMLPPFKCLKLPAEPPFRINKLNASLMGECKYDGAFIKEPPRKFGALANCKMSEEVANAPYFVVIAPERATNYAQGEEFKLWLRSAVVHELGHAYVFKLRERLRYAFGIKPQSVGANALIRAELAIRQGRNVDFLDFWLNFLDYGTEPEVAHVEFGMGSFGLSVSVIPQLNVQDGGDQLLALYMAGWFPARVAEEFTAQLLAYVHLDGKGRELMAKRRWGTVEYDSFRLAIGHGPSWNPGGCLAAKSWASGLPLFIPYVAPLPTAAKTAYRLVDSDLCRMPCDPPMAIWDRGLLLKGPRLTRVAFRQMLYHYVNPPLWRKLSKLVNLVFD